MLLIKDIIWINEEIGEADVIVTDGQYDIRCFAHPFFQQIGEEVEETLSVFEHFGITQSKTREYVVEHLGNGEYFFIARLIDEVEGIIQIGEITIHDIDKIPENIKKGDYIQFFTLRVDLW